MTSHAQTLSDFHALTDRFGEVVAAGTPDRWGAPSPCEGWVASDVVDHVVDSQRDFLTRQGLDLGERAAGSPDQVWSSHAAAVRAALGDGTVLATEFDSFFGPSSIGATLATFYNLDLVIHRWDLATALGDSTGFTDAEMELAEASLAQLGDNIYAHGACAPAVELGAAAERQDRLLARTGRDPHLNG